MRGSNQAPSLLRFARNAPAMARMLVDQLRSPVLQTPLGKGQPVIVIPGLLSADITTRLLRRTLCACGFAARGWGLGVNRGANAAKFARLADDLRQSGQPVVLIGVSLGGLYARELAFRYPEWVRGVITLGSPFSGDLRANNAWRIYELVNGHKVDNPPVQMTRGAKPTPYTVAFWSDRDGMIAPECARGLPEETDEQIEVPTPHMMICTDAEAIMRITNMAAEIVARNGSARG